MQRLGSPAPVPTSQEGGNLMQPDLAAAAMTAPGSEPVTPLPAPLQGSNVPEPHEGSQLPVNMTRGRWSTGEPADGMSWEPFGDAGVPHESAPWVQL